MMQRHVVDARSVTWRRDDQSARQPLNQPVSRSYTCTHTRLAPGAATEATRCHRFGEEGWRGRRLVGGQPARRGSAAEASLKLL
jgi:hypothetical protein